MKRILEKNNHNLLILNELDLNEENEIINACDKLVLLQKEMDLIHPLIEEYKEYIECVGDTQLNSKKAVRVINNYLTAYKSFIDHWETYSKRNKDEGFVKFFKDALSDIYNRRFEYRFIYNLRNYAQHNGSPISSLTKSFARGVEIILIKDEFIKNHKGMQPKFRTELQSIEEIELDVDKAIRIVHQELIQLSHKLFNKQLNSLGDEYLKAAISISDFYNEYNTHGGSLSLVDSESIESLEKMITEPGEAKLKFYSIPHLFAKAIIKDTNLKFKYKGKCIGENQGFPTLIKPKFVLEVPEFKTGSQFVKFNDVTWIRVLDSTGFINEDGYERYFALYMPRGLLMKEYEEQSQRYQKEIDELFNKRT